MQASLVAAQRQLDTGRLPLELWQAEWCPSSRRVRQVLTELDLTFIAHQVPVEGERREQLLRETGSKSIPVLVADGHPIAGEESIIAYLHEHFSEPPEADAHRRKAVLARKKELENECPQMSAATH